MYEHTHPSVSNGLFWVFFVSVMVSFYVVFSSTQPGNSKSIAWIVNFHRLISLFHCIRFRIFWITIPFLTLIFFEVHAQPNNSHRFANFWSVRDFSLLPKSFCFIDRLFSRKFERNLNKINYFRKIWSINICLFSLSLRSVTIRTMPSEAELMRKWQKNWSENSHVTTTNIWMLLRVLFEIQNVNTYTVVSKCYAIL